MHISRARFALSFLCFVMVAGCGAQMKVASAPMAASAAPSIPNAPPPLDRSLFARDPSGTLSEDALQKILASPIELDLPARVGVLPIATHMDWRGPGPDDRVPAGLAPLVKTLRKDRAFTLVTQTLVIPSGALGMEALREIAARYRLRYLLLYREVLAKDSAFGAWAFGYATVVGALFLPGKFQEVYGYTEVSMFDVKTGLLMFTTRRAVAASHTTNQWHQATKLDKLAAAAVTKSAPDLATDVLADLRRFAVAAVAENAQRTGKSVAGLVSHPSLEGEPLAGPTMATDANN